MVNSIVTTNVSQTVAPTPSKLQKTGALISQGATTTAAGTQSLLTELGDLDAIIKKPLALASLAWEGLVTGLTAAPHGFALNTSVTLVVAGETPSGYNGTYSAHITGPSSFTYVNNTNPGVETVQGTIQGPSAAISSITWNTGVVTVVTTAPHPFATGASVNITIAGVTVHTSYNGNFLCTIVDDVTFTYALVGDPGGAGTPGTYQPETVAISGLSWAGQVTATTVDPHGLTISTTDSIIIAGATPTGYNGTYTCAITTTTQFTYTLNVNPGAETIAGTYFLASNVPLTTELTAMATTFFAQGASVAVYVLELGDVADSAAIAFLGTHIAASPQFFYSYLVPKSWSSSSDFLAFVADFEALTAKTYFWTTMTTGNYTSFNNRMKCVIGLVEAPGTPSTEFSLAAAFWVSLHYNPSATQRVTPFAFSYLFGVTPYPPSGNNVLLAALKAANVNIVGTGAEGGISNATLFWGTTMDGRDFTYWYSVDWVQINGDLDISNAIINGSNNPLNPLYYNQQGINRLQAVVVGMARSGIAFGLILGDVVTTKLSNTDFQAYLDSGAGAGKTVVNAEPFITYSQEHPGDYKIGEYDGLSIAYVPARGFTHIVFNIQVSDFVTQ